MNSGVLIYVVVFATERRTERARSGVGFASVNGCLSESAVRLWESRSRRFEAQSMKHDILIAPQPAIPSDETV